MLTIDRFFRFLWNSLSSLLISNVTCNHCLARDSCGGFELTCSKPMSITSFAISDLFLWVFRAILAHTINFDYENVSQKFRIGND